MNYLNKKNMIFFVLILFSILISNDKIVYSVPIEGDIDMGLPFYLERVIKEAEKEDADYIIFNIDTFGGRVDAATKIKDAILNSKVPTIAFINKRAISAGALISLSCNYIYMTSGGTIGAATAVDGSGKKTSEKVISYMREEMASTAEANNRSREIAAAMVDDEIEIDYLITISGDTLTSKDISGFKEYKLITLSTGHAVDLGIANAEVNTFEELLTYIDIPDAKVVQKSTNWSEGFVRFFTSPTVAPLLMSLGFLGLMFEIKSPGFGVPGIGGLICLGLFFGSHLLVGLADITEILILAAGIILILAEIFIVPGFGITGIGGIGLLLYGLFLILIGEYPQYTDYINAFWGLNIGFIGAIIAIFMFFKFLVKSKFYKNLNPVQNQKKSDGFSISVGYEDLIGKLGVTKTALRPVGIIMISGKEYHCRSKGDFIESNMTIKVEGIEENELIVSKK
ncbi:MAG: NfeD family protein [Candidatus Neomarinimicrobiota bacterium]|jgi:membrane-bound serine protease (ClpP class)|nr:NfeD family protein [Candidatus Neomarinimicrobiota bacterium]|tara:strand:- start:653 stop:2014 length:1362 start_codon:yes stop_codon:yes gene_type:complete